MAKITPLYDAREIAERVEALGGEIREAAGSGEVFLLGILKGASLFLADLLRAVPGEVSYGFIDVIRDHADQGSDAIELDFLSFTDIRDRDVFVLKDVVATGVIENYLLANLRMHQPRSLRLVALLDRPEARTSELKVDFRAFTVGDGVFAGYGLEQERRFGNLPFIGRMA